MQRHRASRRQFGRSYWSMKAALSVACSALLVASCSPTVLDGRALSMLYDPNRVSGLPATDGPSGPRNNAPQPTGTVENTDGGEVDRLALSAINDIEDFWKQNFSESRTALHTGVAPAVVRFERPGRVRILTATRWGL